MRYNSLNRNYGSTLIRAGRAFVRGTPWKHYPLYAGAAVFAGWLGFLTLAFLGQHHPDADTDTARVVADASRLMAYLFVFHPMLLGAGEVVREFRGGGT